MPYAFEFVNSDNCIVVTWTGTMTIEEFSTFFRELESQPEFRPGWSRLFDYRAANLYMSPDLIREFDTLVARVDHLHGQRRLVFLVYRDIDFGMMRLFISISERPQQNAHITRDLEEAKTWIGLPAEYVLPADRPTRLGIAGWYKLRQP